MVRFGRTVAGAAANADALDDERVDASALK
jgi:hypothetical protein